LLHFAKRRSSESTTESSIEPNSADESLSLADFPGPSGSLVVAATASIAPSEAGYHTESSNTQASPAQAPATGESTWVLHACAAFSLVQLVDASYYSTSLHFGYCAFLYRSYTRNVVQELKEHCLNSRRNFSCGVDVVITSF